MNKKTIWFIILAFVIITTIVFSGCSSAYYYSTAVNNIAEENALSCDYIFIDDVLYFFEYGYNSSWICKLENNKKKIIVRESEINCTMKRGLVSEEHHLFFVGKTDEESIFFRYNIENGDIERCGSTSYNNIIKWGRLKNKYYFSTVENNNIPIQLLCEFDPNSNKTFVVSESIVNFSIDNEKLIWIEKEKTNYKVYKLLSNGEIANACTVPCLTEVLPLNIYLNDYAVLLCPEEENSRLFVFDDCKEYEYPENIYDAILSGNSVYFITYTIVEKDGWYTHKPESIYVRNFDKTEALILSTNLETPRFVGCLSDNSVLYCDSENRLFKNRNQLYYISGTEKRFLIGY